MLTKMKHSQNVLQLTEKFEGCKYRAYQDSGGVWTIGFGHTRGVFQDMVCTVVQAIDWLIEDYKIAEDAVNHLVLPQLNQDEFDALCDFVFNVGATNFLHSTLLKMLNLKDYKGAAGQLLVWDHCDGKVLAGLLARRVAEENLFNEGVNNETSSQTA